MDSSLRVMVMVYHLISATIIWLCLYQQTIITSKIEYNISAKGNTLKKTGGKKKKEPCTLKWMYSVCFCIKAKTNNK